MEIKKADSKGRVSGFEPGEYYVLHRHIGHFHKLQTEFSPTPERDLVKEITGATDDEIERLGGLSR